MYLPSLFIAVVYASLYILLLFAAVCLACGLYYLVELAEEYTTFTKRVIRLAILGELVLHFLLWAYERMWFLPSFIGVVSHTSYLLLLRSFPFIEPSSSSFIAASMLFLADNFFWYRSFHKDPEFLYKFQISPTPAMASFYFLVVWLVPLGFFVSLTVNDSVLPSGIQGNTSRYGNAAHPHSAEFPDTKKRKSQNIFVVGARNIMATIRGAIGNNDSSRDFLSSAAATTGFR